MQAYLPWLAAAEYESLAARPDPFAHPATALRRILVETRLYHRLALDWLRRNPPALSFVYFQGTDMIGHVFAPYAPPRQPAIGEADFERYHRVPEAYFREIDAILGEYRKVAEETGAVAAPRLRPRLPLGPGPAGAPRQPRHRHRGPVAPPGGHLPALGPRHRARGGARATAAWDRSRRRSSRSWACRGLPASRSRRWAASRRARRRATTGRGPSTAAAGAPANPASQEALERLRALGYLGAGESATRPAGAESGTRTAGSYNNEGVLLREAGRLPEAQAAFEQALRLDPHAASAAHNLSVMLTESEPERADALLLGALADGLGDGARIVVSAASAHQQAGDSGRARRLIDGAIERRPADPGLRVLRGRARLEARDCAGALDDFEQARRAAPAGRHASTAWPAPPCFASAAPRRAARRWSARWPSIPRRRASGSSSRECDDAAAWGRLEDPARRRGRRPGRSRPGRRPRATAVPSWPSA